jgi:predicted TIM-barrel fold metal-dependent hydrolase
MIIDYTSKPPLPEHQHAGPHMQGYDRVYAQSYKAAKRDEIGPDALSEYLALYERVDAKYVVIKARDCERTLGYRVRNETVAEFCRTHSPRFIGLAGVDPHKGALALRELEHAVRELGLWGLNLHPYENRISIDDAKMYPLYAKCIEMDIPLNLHCSMSFDAGAEMDMGHPRRLDRVMTHFPELRVCAAPPGFPWVEELVAVAWRHPNVRIGVTAVRPKYLCLENAGYGALLSYGNTVLKDRILWGSAWPMQPVETALKEIDALPLKDEVRHMWLYENASRFLRL